MMTTDTRDWPARMRELGRQIRRVREFLGLSQDQVARLAGVSQGAVSRLEAGRGLATPMLIVLKVHLVLARALSAFDPALLDDQIRETLGLGGLMAAAPTAAENGAHPITRDRDLEEMVQLYRSLSERQRRTLVAVVRATATSLVKGPEEKSEFA
jgi:transcriptional regulator with XRE-family HTH domain